MRCNSVEHSSVFFSFSCLVTNATGLRARAGKRGRQKSGPKTYGGENDSGRLQVHLTASEAVKQTRYVNGPNCKRGGGCEKEERRIDDQNQEPEKGKGPASIIFFLVLSCVR
jgi:hypothetical protein